MRTKRPHFIAALATSLALIASSHHIVAAPPLEDDIFDNEYNNEGTHFSCGCDRNSGTANSKCGCCNRGHQTCGHLRGQMSQRDCCGEFGSDFLPKHHIPCGDCTFSHLPPVDTGKGSWFNCGCNGSYKFPVPPLYTYHWVGLYSHQLMTDYQSPWRFAPIKPFAEDYREHDDGGLQTTEADVDDYQSVTWRNEADQVKVSNDRGSLLMSEVMKSVYENDSLR